MQAENHHAVTTGFSNRRKGMRTSLSRMGANVPKTGSMILRNRDGDVLPLEINELKAILNSSLLDCSEPNS